MFGDWETVTLNEWCGLVRFELVSFIFRVTRRRRVLRRNGKNETFFCGGLINQQINERTLYVVISTLCYILWVKSEIELTTQHVTTCGMGTPAIIGALVYEYASARASVLPHVIISPRTTLFGILIPAGVLLRRLALGGFSPCQLQDRHAFFCIR